MNVALVDPTDETFSRSLEHKVANSVVTIQREIKELFQLTQDPDARRYLLRESKDILAACGDLQTVYQHINRMWE